MTIGFIGLGNMGLPMAQNLLRSGHTLKVFDLSSSAVSTAEQDGAIVMSSAAEAVEGSAIVITMLPGDQQVLDLYLAKHGLLSHGNGSTLFVDCSTVAATTSQTIAVQADAMGTSMIDAPVSGGTVGAAAATLTFMVGGPDAAFQRVQPVLKNMGANVFHAGAKVGDGQLAKACNNMLLAALMIGTSEALQLGADNGLDIAKLTEIMRQSSGDNWVLNKYHPWPGEMPAAPASHDYEPGFMVKLMTKDLGLAMQTALASGTPTPLGAMARSIYAQHGRDGWDEKDFSSVLTRFSDNK
ncbi:3-hydroxyisobutyrate dehydrogenase [Corallincola holothuriorum]|uniref:3-hydroxyisobutyrate dehydrogenase n=1 Tax=Corallincola holothuriorum TaxID=2282215 RepID=A0A368NIA7_9GAMM|nr:3-hydroxyisobutyrate dehydrogenase [Corallincola holothuriorum]RCU49623.1 3-hydroxyisobutyrate dehydrogenase [Corallincola holothuriorum]